MTSTLRQSDDKLGVRRQILKKTQFKETCFQRIYLSLRDNYIFRMSEPSARSGQPLGACAPTSLAKKPQELVLSMPMEKHLVCSKREDWRVCWPRKSGELLLCILKNSIVRLA